MTSAGGLVEISLDRLGLRQMLLEPELLETVDADVHLVASLLSLSSVIPAKTKETARRVVRKVVNDLEERLRRRSNGRMSRCGRRGTGW